MELITMRLDQETLECIDYFIKYVQSNYGVKQNRSQAIRSIILKYTNELKESNKMDTI